ncbi:hypothetical protein LUZ60_007894 [Juncus effusus]|nr:hypothetical protein LUZ60_007894 [Juncus effusus]
MDRRRVSGFYSAPTSPAHPLFSPAANKKPTSKLKSMTNALLAHKMTKALRDYDESGYGYEYGDEYGGGGGRSKGGGYGAERVAPVAGRYPSPKLGRNGVENNTAYTTNNINYISSRKTPVPIVPPVSAPIHNSTQFVPPAVRSPSPLPTLDIPSKRPPSNDQRENPKMVEKRDARNTDSLLDQVDLLQEENDNLLEKLRLMERKFNEADARSKTLEKQVASQGDGLSMEVRLMKKKEEFLLKKEREMKETMMRKKEDKGEEIDKLKKQLEKVRDKAESAMEKLKEAESDSKALRIMTHRMILTDEEMEEVVMKRCWLARYWGLAIKYGVYPEIAIAKHEHWSSFAPLPFEYVSAAGQRAKDNSSFTEDSEKPNKISDIVGDGNIESMLSVEKGLRELALLKVEEAVILALAQHRHPNLLRPSVTDFLSPGDPKYMEAFELSEEEVEDVMFKQAWIVYFWRRAKTHNLEEDISEERLQFWIHRLGKTPNSHDAIDVERALEELRKLGIEDQLWEASRHDIDNSVQKPATDKSTEVKS